MKTWLLTAALTIAAAAGARAESIVQLGSDPLSRQILAKTVQENGGVTAAVRLGSGQVVPLNVGETATAALAPAANPADLALKTAPALAAAPKKTAKKAKAPKAAKEQLKHVAAAKSWSEKR